MGELFFDMAKNARRKKTKKIIRDKKEKARAVFKAVLIDERVFSNAHEALDLYSKSRFGEPIEGKVYYSLVEALYLLEKGKIIVFENKKKLTKEGFIERARKIELQFWTRYCVFRDMRNRGYIVKTALKFGADFRVYDKGVKPGEDHAKWVLFPVYESSNMTWHEFAAKNRVAHSTKKKLLIAIVDDEGDITYYEIGWTRP